MSARPTEVVYLGRNNRIDLLLKENNAVVDLSPLTSMDLLVGEEVISSSNQASDAIRWAQEGFATGEVRLSLGDTELTAMSTVETATLVVYDSTNVDGIVWGSFNILIKSGV